MKTATISLKQLRTDPREYVRLINAGHRVRITEHRKTLAETKPVASKHTQKGDIATILATIKSLPPIKTPYPQEDTVELIKRTKREYMEEKYGGHK